MTVKYFVGDVREVLASLPEASVDLVLTSPPFLALRSYLKDDDPMKHLEIGSESTPGEFVDTLLDVVEATARVLAPHGSMCIELGDSFGGSGGAGSDYNEGGLREGQPKFRANRGGIGGRASYVENATGGHHNGGDGWPLDRSLCLVPEIFRFSLVYGFNPLTGRETSRWRARNVIRWCRNNPAVGALSDKFRPATSDIVVVCKDRRWFDLDAVRNGDLREPSSQAPSKKALEHEALGNHGKGMPAAGTWHANGGAPPLDHWWEDDTFTQDAWNIPTQSYRGSHYATWPEALLVKPILSMCPEKVCRVCGKPSTRITERSPDYAKALAEIGDFNERPLDRSHGNSPAPWGPAMKIRTAENITTGWTDCGHDSWRPGVVLDPFGGSGTTGRVATGLGRDAWLIDLDGKNLDLARERCGMFLEEVEWNTTQNN